MDPKTKPSKALKDYIKQVKENSIGKIFIDLTCRVCKETTPIRVNNPELYTREVRENWVCSKRKCRETKKENKNEI